MPCSRLQRWAETAKRELLTVYYVSRHPRTPRVAKFAAAAVLLYALSPLDLIPDVVPVLGYLDDALLLPFGVMLVARLVPRGVWSECRAEAAARSGLRLPQSRAGAVVVVIGWLAVLCLLVWFIRKKCGRVAHPL